MGVPSFSGRGGGGGVLSASADSTSGAVRFRPIRPVDGGCCPLSASEGAHVCKQGGGGGGAITRGGGGGGHGPPCPPHGDAHARVFRAIIVLVISN